MVYIPRYGLKGTCLLKSKNPNTLLPSHYGSSPRNLDIDTLKQRITIETNKGIIEIVLGTGVKVRINGKDSRFRRPELDLELLNFFPIDKKIKDVAITDRINLMKQVKQAEEEAKQLQLMDQIKIVLPDTKKYLQSDGNSVYDMFNNFAKLSLHDATV